MIRRLGVLLGTIRAGPLTKRLLIGLELIGGALHLLEGLGVIPSLLDIGGLVAQVGLLVDQLIERLARGLQLVELLLDLFGIERPILEDGDDRLQAALHAEDVVVREEIVARLQVRLDLLHVVDDQRLEHPGVRLLQAVGVIRLAGLQPLGEKLHLLVDAVEVGPGLALLARKGTPGLSGNREPGPYDGQEQREDRQ